MKIERVEDETAYTDKEFELGVLFIHGIGTQTRGQTLAAFGGPLLRWIQDRCEAVDLVRKKEAASQDSEEGLRQIKGVMEWRSRLEAVEWGRAGTPAPSFAPADPNATDKVLLRRPLLNETLFKDPSDSAAPAHTKMTILSLERDERVTADRWLLAESWWANSFSPPTFKELALWGLGVLPWMIGSHFGAHVQRRWREWRNGPPDQNVQSGNARRNQHIWVALSLWRLGTAIGGVGVGLLCAIVMVPILAGLLALGFIPIPKLRKALLDIQLRTAATLGDSYVFVSRPIEAASIVGRARRDLLWLARRCAEVVIIAHSQGAAVAHLALRDSIPKELTLLFTFGSGLRKLEEVQALAQSGRRQVLGSKVTLVVLIVLVVFGWAILVHMFRTVFGTEKLEMPKLLVNLGVFVLFLLFFLGGIGEQIRGINLQKLNRWIKRLKSPDLHFRWIDCYASADPVPNGIVDPDAVELSREVCNRSSMLADHTTYWTNSDEFVSLLFEEIAKSRAKDTYPDLRLPNETFTRIAERRRWRVAIGRTIQWIGIAGLLIVFARNWPACQNFVVWGWTRIGVFLSSIFGIETSNLGSFAVDWKTIGSIALVLVPYGIVRMIWTSWNNREMQNALGLDPSLSHEVDIAKWASQKALGLETKETRYPPSFWALTVFLSVLLYIVVDLAMGRSPPWWILPLSTFAVITVFIVLEPRDKR